MLTLAGSHINTVRARTAEADTLRAEQRMRGILQCVDFRPASLPETAILLVRHLSVPAHEVLTPAQWEARVHGALDDLVRRAARPAPNAAFPNNPDAVLFDDQAQLLACMVSDWFEGALASRWWWHAIGLPADLRDLIRRYLLRRPECIPAVMELLAPRRLPVALVRASDVATCEQLFASVATVFGLHHLVDIPDRIASARIASREKLLPPCPVASERVEATPHPIPPWSGWAPEADDESLGDMIRRVLLAVSLGLVRVPNTVRTTSFAADVVAFSDCVSLRNIEPERDIRTPSRAFDPSSPVSKSLPEIAASMTTELFQSTTRSPRASTPPGEGERVPLRLPSQPNDESVRLGDPGAPSDGLSTPEASADRCITMSDDVGPELRVDPVPEARPSASSASPSITHTGCGGLFYLINTGIRLGFYSDFTSPLNTGIDLPIWDFLSLAGGHFLGDGFVDDPICGLLAALSGRDAAEPPGPGEQAQFDDLAPAIVDSLCVALDRPERDEIPSVLLRHDARAAVTATHLTVTFSLGHLPISIRLAGLDRNPGWVPAAGRVVTFCFECEDVCR